MLCGNYVLTLVILTTVSGAKPVPNYTKQWEAEYITLDEAIAIWRGSHVDKRTIEEDTTLSLQRNCMCPERTDLSQCSSMNNDYYYSDISNDSN